MKTRFLVLIALIIVSTLFVSAAFATTYVVKTEEGDPLNIRDAAGGGAIVGQLRNGSVIEVEKFVSGWAKIGEDKYVWGEYLQQYGGEEKTVTTQKKQQTTVANVINTSDQFVVTDLVANVYRVADEKSAILEELHCGDVVFVVSQTGNEWFKINYEDGKFAYVKKSAIVQDMSVFPDEGKLYMINSELGTMVTVREEGKRDAEIVARLRTGYFVKVIERNGNWCKIYYHGDEIGYVTINSLLQIPTI